ncbi:MAG: phage/plasmid primase, P4 family [Halobacteriota archaeon]
MSGPTLEGFIEELDTLTGAPVLMRDFYKATDIGNAERFVDRYGDTVRYCAELTTWYIWEGRYWRPDTTLKIRQYAKATALHIIEEVDRVRMPDKKEEKAAQIELVKWAHKSQNQQRLSAMLYLAESDERIALNASAFDSDPFLFTVQNGTLDLRLGADELLRDFKREDLITKIAPVAYADTAYSPEWQTRLKEVLGDEQAAFLQRACGMALTGVNEDKALFVLYGRANTRKSTMLEPIFKTFGDYARPVNISLFARSMQRAGGARADLVSLDGVRAAQCSEVPRGMKFNDAFMKAVTSENPQAARGLYETRERKIRPQTKFFIETNFLPEIHFDDDASFNRFHITQFLNAIDLDDCDPSIKRFLLNDEETQDAIFRWIVDGCLDWQESGLKPPSSVNAARVEYQRSMNPLAPFLENECVIEEGAEVTTKVLWERFDAVATFDEHQAVKDERAFGMYLTQSKFENVKRSGKRTRLGIRLKTLQEHDAEDENL